MWIEGQNENEFEDEYGGQKNEFEFEDEYGSERE
jgi:hypothetical protein